MPPTTWKIPKRLYYTLLGLFVVVGGILTLNNARAITIDFEDGTTGGLYGILGSAIIATTSNSYTGNWSGELLNGAGLITKDYGGATTSGNYFLAYFGNSFAIPFVLTDNAGFTGCNFNATGTWNIAGIQWNGSDFRCYSNGVWSGWTNLGLTFSRINIAPTLNIFWIDDVNTSFSPVAYGNPILTPTNPINCVWNATDTFSGIATGNLTIPTDNPNYWTKLEIIFTDKFSGNSFVFNQTFDLYAGKNLNYSIPYSLASSTSYDVWYNISGYELILDPETGIVTQSGVSYQQDCNTGYGNVYVFAPEIISPPPLPPTEDCSGYDLLPRLVCELKNYIGRIFLPDASTTLALHNNLDLVRQKFPYNYIFVTKDFISGVKNELSTSTPVLSLFGATSTFGFGIFDANVNFAGSNQSIASILRTFFTFIILLAFVFWAIDYLRKIFK